MMLENIKAGRPVAFGMIGADKDLTREVQLQLGKAGLLDPPADGSFGPVSRWALAQFLARAVPQEPLRGILSQTGAEALLAAGIEAMFPLELAGDFAGRIVNAMVERGDWICRHPDCVNIVYVDGTNVDGKRNADAHNKFDDVRILIRVADDGRPFIDSSWDATTEPGAFYVKVKKLDPRGAAHIVSGQYKAWSVGIHKEGAPNAHEALVQTADITITRDLDENFNPVGDRVFEGMFGINQHWGFDLPHDDVRDASAGCLVGRTKNGHRDFMKRCKLDPRYQANNSYRFMTAVLPPSSVNP